MQIEITPKYYFKSIQEFQFVRDIGVGSFGKVKLAVHRGTRKPYAIKTIDLTPSLTTTQLQLIAREIKIHSRLDHPHVVKLWDTLYCEGRAQGDGNGGEGEKGKGNYGKIYMIMQYARHGSLFSHHTKLLKQSKQIKRSHIYKWFYQTLQAVKYIHSLDLMHRDLKPQNLLLDQNYNIKVCDFGWATNNINSKRNTFCGTYQYMAPQMVLENSYDYRIDVWALGVLLFELVHGKAPFQADNLRNMRQKINKGAYEINSQVQQQLKDLIVDILQFIPDKRLTVKQIQRHNWVQFYQKQQLSTQQLLMQLQLNVQQQQQQEQINQVRSIFQLSKSKKIRQQVVLASSNHSNNNHGGNNSNGIGNGNVNRKVRKYQHQHQKSMGSFIPQTNTNTNTNNSHTFNTNKYQQSELLSQTVSTSKLHENSSVPLLILKPSSSTTTHHHHPSSPQHYNHNHIHNSNADLFKKHRRNITQPIHSTSPASAHPLIQHHHQYHHHQQSTLTNNRSLSPMVTSAHGYQQNSSNLNVDVMTKDNLNNIDDHIDADVDDTSEQLDLIEYQSIPATMTTTTKKSSVTATAGNGNNRVDKNVNRNRNNSNNNCNNSNNNNMNMKMDIGRQQWQRQQQKQYKKCKTQGNQQQLLIFQAKIISKNKNTHHNKYSNNRNDQQYSKGIGVGIGIGNVNGNKKQMQQQYDHQHEHEHQIKYEDGCQRRRHLRTETGPTITRDSTLGHLRNYSSNQLRDHHQLQLQQQQQQQQLQQNYSSSNGNSNADKMNMKKKQKLQEKTCQKIRRIQEKMHELSNKLTSAEKNNSSKITN